MIYKYVTYNIKSPEITLQFITINGKYKIGDLIEFRNAHGIDEVHEVVAHVNIIYKLKKRGKK